MDLRADISWIKSELDKINDPYLIEVFKSLLKYREHSIAREMDEMILQGEEDVRNGKLTSQSDLMEEMKGWRRQK